MQGSKTVRCAIRLLACLGLSACVNQPRYGTEVQSTDQLQQFDGYVSEASAAVTVQAAKYNETTQSCNTILGWENIAGIRAGTSVAFTDDCGVKWYQYKKSVQLPNRRRNWCLNGNAAFFQSEYRVLWNGGALPSFNLDAESTCHPSRNCLNTVSAECGFSDGIIALHCINRLSTCQVKF